MESYGHRTNDIILEWKEDVPIRISDKVMNELIYSRFSKIKLSLHTITNAKISPWTLKNLKEKKDILKESFSCLQKFRCLLDIFTLQIKRLQSAIKLIPLVKNIH